MKVYDKDGQEIDLATITDLSSKMDKETVIMNNLPTSNTNSFVFKTEKDISVNGITIPAYSRGIFINQEGSRDGVLIAVDVPKYLYIGFRNNGNWSLIKI